MKKEYIEIYEKYKLGKQIISDGTEFEDML
jgi:hypothetical protein